MTKEINDIVIDGYQLKRMIIKSIESIFQNEDLLNKLNYFPVRDSDTGSNLKHMFQKIKERIDNVEINHFGKLLEIIKEAAVKNSKGNSGNIFSMFIYGLYEELKNKEKVTIKDLRNAIKKAKDYAYSSVANPKEGTMLTVFRVMEEECKKSKDILTWICRSIKNGLKELKKKRKEINLKKAIDSGGLAVLLFLKGWAEALGKKINIKINTITENENAFTYKGFCVNILAKPKKSLEEIKEKLNSLDSLVIGEQKEYLKIHFHCKNLEDIIPNLENIIEIEKIDIEEINS
ncbi:MAG: DAK2 domain-containing protein [Candidatus Aenigmatarchaeota archaeon]